ncbi:hypothetical protein [Candidatus Magnetaquicoccus inordinatus]|uniref:hypothetical protein n=1 Tax=Candidatus Magnetaquicoccus inordinatus TaxID=2496818 RepID=UPI00102C9DB7|nr:hypothetical protein [Candidatus Magnetaquicoccus inordinatus]
MRAAEQIKLGESWRASALGTTDTADRTEPKMIPVEEFLSMLTLLESGLCQIADGEGATILLDPLFRAMSDMYRRSAASGMDDFSDLAYELAQAFGTAQTMEKGAIQRLARLALLAIGQLRRILRPYAPEQPGQYAKQVVTELLNCWA